MVASRMQFYPCNVAPSEVIDELNIVRAHIIILQSRGRWKINYHLKGPKSYDASFEEDYQKMYEKNKKILLDMVKYK